MVRQESCHGLSLPYLLRWTYHIFLAQDAPLIMYVTSLRCNGFLYFLHLATPGSRDLVRRNVDGVGFGLKLRLLRLRIHGHKLSEPAIELRDDSMEGL